MGYEQIITPRIACPHCQLALPIDAIEGEPQIFRHVSDCDGDLDHSGFVEASEAAGVDPEKWDENWDEFVLR